MIGTAGDRLLWVSGTEPILLRTVVYVEFVLSPVRNVCIKLREAFFFERIERKCFFCRNTFCVCYFAFYVMQMINYMSVGIQFLGSVHKNTAGSRLLLVIKPPPFLLPKSSCSKATSLNSQFYYNMFTYFCIMTTSTNN